MDSTSNRFSKQAIQSEMNKKAMEAIDKEIARCMKKIELLNRGNALDAEITRCQKKISELRSDVSGRTRDTSLYKQTC